MIEVERLSFRYPGGALALKEVSVRFAPGKVSAVLGESGSGKTTFLLCIGRFLRFRKGTVRLDGADIRTLPEREFRRRVGIVFQHLYLFPHLTVLENMMLAPVHVLGRPGDEAEAEARKMLDRLDIGDLAQSYPGQVSGGQAQRVAIARALLLRPDYLFLDEPTSALDAKTADDFAAWLKGLKDTTNFVVVTHNLLFAESVATEGVYLSGGRVLDTGPVGRIAGHARAGKLVTRG
ncbi:MAG TPA: amino acid ABC transporter ATP-binding protein [candidate division WOR-3 bacterium]|uniref:Amino acid ABC transporter ATP-binding protein n=1 Tax=candidate division WOR-3 bacterium TaxID=2052148 RepID=A0A7V0T694_UNCW3|nr:amino acid ABC transporter ATP-binding protein [candidate division WOR-3 bacterium]